MNPRHAIEVEGLTKVYQLGTAEARRYKTLRDGLVQLWRRDSKTRRTHRDEILALDNVSFTAEEGEAIGIIGRNGAGKSTLLKILSRITEPTAGHARLFGRVASLLEVGTGFHPELTGRENIFLNGAILGMTRDEIRRHFDAIVAFAEVERFLDTPVKRYSSGMFVRLAFAVAAHLTPEILIVDEVLAVGDHEFQKRCLGRMHEVANSGRTVLFVSHNLATIEALCTRCLLVRAGKLDAVGPTAQVLSQYLSHSDGPGKTWDFVDWHDREGTGRARITRIEVFPQNGGAVTDPIVFRGSFRVRIHFHHNETILAPTFGIALLTERDERIFLTHTPDLGLEIPLLDRSGFIDCEVRSPNVLPGVYRLEAWITDVYNVSFADHLRMVGRLEIVIGEEEGGNLAGLTTPVRGKVMMDCAWSEPASC